MLYQIFVMRASIIIVIGSFGLSLFSIFTFAQGRSVSLNGLMERRIDSLLQSYHLSGNPGAAVLIYEQGEVRMAKGYGIKNSSTAEKVSAQTCFRLASLTKQFTAMSILQLSQAGKILLDSPVHFYLDSLPAYAQGITIRHLLTHTSGLPDYEDLIPAAQKEQVLDIDCLRLLHTTQQLYFEPGTAYRYSNTGYALLALVVAQVSGEDFASYLRKHIFKPLGMKHTVALEAGKSNVADRAMGHSRLADAWQLTDQSITSAVLGDGGIYTNVLDYARWIKALLSHRFISDSLQKVAWQKARLKNGNSVNYGYGWHVDEIRGKSYPHHSGSSIGFRNHILLFPDKERAVVILTNRNEGNPYELALQITDLVWPVTAD